MTLLYVCVLLDITSYSKLLDLQTQLEEANVTIMRMKSENERLQDIISRQIEQSTEREATSLFQPVRSSSVV